MTDEYIPKRAKPDEGSEYIPQHAAGADNDAYQGGEDVFAEIIASNIPKEPEHIRPQEPRQNPQPKPTKEPPSPMDRDSKFQRRLNTMTTVLLGVVFAVIVVLLTVLERPERSITEQRPLEKFPEFTLAGYFDGSYTKGITTWYTDTAPHRDELKDISSNLASLSGIRVGGVKIYGVGGIESSEEEPSESSQPEEQSSQISAIPEVSQESSESSTTESSQESQSSQEESFPEEDPAEHPTGLEMEEGLITNGILVIKDRGIMLYGGGLKVGENYANIVNTYKKQLGDGVNVYSMVIPTSVAYYLPKEYESYTASQFNNIKNIHDHLDSSVHDVDVYSVLAEHTDENIYTRTDHHWASLGAYYSAQKFASIAGVPFADISTYEKVTVPGYVGTLYTYTKDAKLLNNPEDFEYYKPANSFDTYYYDISYNGGTKGNFFIDFTNMKGSLYCTFMGGDCKIVRVANGSVNNGRKLIVLKESYGNALIPFLTASFEEVYVVDIRYFELNVIDFIRQHDITDVLFANCAFTATGPNCKHFERIRTYGGETAAAADNSDNKNGGVTANAD